MTSLTTYPSLRRRDQAVGPGGRQAAVPLDPGPLLGRWANYDQQTTGILEAEVVLRARLLVVRIRGSAGPSREAVATAFSAGVREREAVGFMGRCFVDSGSILLAAYLNKRLLVLDAYTVFTDTSRRSNYFQRDHFYLPRPSSTEVMA